MRTPQHTSLAAIPLLLALGCHSSSPGDTDGQSTGVVTSGTGSGEDTEVQPPAPGPRIPIANSVMVRAVDAEGNPITGAWIKHLKTVGPGDPDDPAPGAIPAAQNTLENKVFTATSTGHILVEGMSPGRQHWMLGAPGFVTSTKVLSVDAGTHGAMTIRMTPLGETFMISTYEPHEVSYKNVDIRFPAGSMINKQTGKVYDGPVAANITVINPVAGSIDAPVVPLVGVDENGDAGNLYSFGMVGVELTDPTSQAPLELSGEIAVKVAFHLDEEQTAFIDTLELRKPNAISALHADATQGDMTWERKGYFFLEKDDEGKYEATTYAVNEFSWINFDYFSMESRCYVIKVVDENNNPIQGKQVKVDYNSTKSGLTGADGTVCWEQIPNTSATATVLPDGIVTQVTSVEGDPHSVCSENIWSYWDDYPHGNCTEITVTIAEPQVCIPGSTWECDDPNQELDGIGLCKAAKQMCEDGTEWSGCQGGVGPSPEICTADPVQVDENCNDVINEKFDDNMNINMGCQCAPGETRDCYPGDESELSANFLCMEGTQECTVDGWGPCTGFTGPNYITEDCDPNNGVESCSANPCDPNAIWWDSMGTVGKHDVLAAHVEKNDLVVVSRIEDGTLENYGHCEQSASPFTGIVVYALNMLQDNPESDPQECSAFMANPGIIEGLIDLDHPVKADAAPEGTAVGAKAFQTIDKDGFATLFDCDQEVPAGRSFVERFQKNGTCKFRYIFPSADYRVDDVAVGDDNEMYVAVTVPASVNHTPEVLKGCSFANNFFTERSFLLRLHANEGLQQVVCENSLAFPNERIRALTVNSKLGNGTLAGVTTNAANEVHARIFTPALDVNNQWELDGPLATFGNNDDVIPLDIAITSGNRVAVIGHYTGSNVTAFSHSVPPAEVSNMLVLVADPLQPVDRGTYLVASGGNDDNVDFGQAIEWVSYKENGDEFDALLMAGTTNSAELTFGACGSQLDPDPGALYDGWVNIMAYNSSNEMYDSSDCKIHRAIHGGQEQVISEVAVSGLTNNMDDKPLRVAVCGNHRGDIRFENGLEQELPNNASRNAHCGYLHLPVAPL